jgi:hypothetical protein
MIIELINLAALTVFFAVVKEKKQIRKEENEEGETMDIGDKSFSDMGYAGG